MQKKFIYTSFLFFGLIVFYSYTNAQPDAVTNLSALQGYLPHQIKLNWTYPGPDTLPPESKYYIQRSTWTGVTWAPSLAQITISTGPVNPSEKQTWIVTGLTGGVTYYFHLWTSSGSAGLISEISNRATFYLVPDAIISLTKSYSAPPQERPGDIVTYTIVYKNIGNIPATNTVIRDKIPQHCEYEKESIFVNDVSKTDEADNEAPPQADYTNGVITVKFNEKLHPGTTGYIQFRVKIK